MRVSLTSGDARVLATVPWVPAVPAVIGSRVYVPVLARDEVLVLDAEQGHLVRTLKVGRRPIGVVAAEGG